MREVHTPLDKLLQPWWQSLTELLPRRLAPNLLTCGASVPMATSYVLAWYCSPDFQTPPPRWLCFFMAASLFSYHILCAVDGTQAKRIGLSTTLGELFDHGVHGVACLSHHSIAATIISPGENMWSMAGLVVVQSRFFMDEWKKQYTGTLSTIHAHGGKFGFKTETDFALMAMAVLAGLLGPDALKALLQRVVLGEAFTVSKLLTSLGIVFNISLMCICFYKTLTFKSVYQEQREKGMWVAPPLVRQHLPRDDLWRVFTDLAPIAVLNFILLHGWHEDVVAAMPRVLCLSSGLLFFYLTAQMIVFSMARMPFHAFQPVILPFAALAFASKFAWLPGEMTMVKLSLIVHTIALSCYVLSWFLTVISELKASLGIDHVFTVPPPKRD